MEEPSAKSMHLFHSLDPLPSIYMCGKLCALMLRVSSSRNCCLFSFTLALIEWSVGRSKELVTIISVSGALMACEALNSPFAAAIGLMMFNPLRRAGSERSLRSSWEQTSQPVNAVINFWHPPVAETMDQCAHNVLQFAIKTMHKCSIRQPVAGYVPDQQEHISHQPTSEPSEIHILLQMDVLQ